MPWCCYHTVNQVLLSSGVLFWRVDGVSFLTQELKSWNTFRCRYSILEDKSYDPDGEMTTLKGAMLSCLSTFCVVCILMRPQGWFHLQRTEGYRIPHHDYSKRVLRWIMFVTSSRGFVSVLFWQKAQRKWHDIVKERGEDSLQWSTICWNIYMPSPFGISSVHSTSVQINIWSSREAGEVMYCSVCVWKCCLHSNVFGDYFFEYHFYKKQMGGNLSGFSGFCLWFVLYCSRFPCKNCVWHAEIAL